MQETKHLLSSSYFLTVMSTLNNTELSQFKGFLFFSFLLEYSTVTSYLAQSSCLH